MSSIFKPLESSPYLHRHRKSGTWIKLAGAFAAGLICAAVFLHEPSASFRTDAKPAQASASAPAGKPGAAAAKTAKQVACEGQTWPYKDPACGEKKAVTVTAASAATEPAIAATEPPNAAKDKRVRIVATDSTAPASLPAAAPASLSAAERPDVRPQPSPEVVTGQPAQSATVQAATAPTSPAQPVQSATVQAVTAPTSPVQAATVQPAPAAAQASSTPDRTVGQSSSENRRREVATHTQSSSSPATGHSANPATGDSANPATGDSANLATGEATALVPVPVAAVVPTAAELTAQVGAATQTAPRPGKPAGKSAARFVASNTVVPLDRDGDSATNKASADEPAAKPRTKSKLAKLPTARQSARKGRGDWRLVRTIDTADGRRLTVYRQAGRDDDDEDGSRSPALRRAMNRPLAMGFASDFDWGWR